MTKTLEELLSSNGVDLRPLTELAIALSQGKRLSGKSREVLSFVLAGRSSHEVQWQRIGAAIMEGEVGSPVTWQGYEWLSFRVPGGTYTPDFMYIFKTGEMAFVEVKGSKRQQGYVTTRQKIRATATLNPWFYFFEVVGKGTDWEVELVTPDVGFIQNIIEVCDG
jgi:hypothetical protein